METLYGTGIRAQGTGHRAQGRGQRAEGTWDPALAGLQPRHIIRMTHMPLASGTRLGAYEVVAPIGAGGMGEVYRARDTRLQRDVALKILPESFATDRDRLARFEREAQLLAALNHP